VVNIEMYSKNHCSYCDKAKFLVQQWQQRAPEQVTFHEYNVESDPARFAELKERAPNSRTFPQIFINNQSIGGCDDLYALDSRGELKRLLNLEN
jgi:glutaredoxin 3